MIETILGFLLDLIIGDPQNPIHPIRIIGSLCKVMEKFFRKVLKKSLKIYLHPQNFEKTSSTKKQAKLKKDLKFASKKYKKNILLKINKKEQKI